MYWLLLICSAIMTLKAFNIAGGENFGSFLIYTFLAGSFQVMARKEKD